VKALAGTAIHAPRKYCKNSGVADTETRRRTISGDTLVGALDSGNSSTETVQQDAKRLVSDGIDALDLEWSIKKLPKSRSQIDLADSPQKRSVKEEDLARRKSTRSAGEKIESLTKKLSVLGKRKLEDGLAKAKRELRNLADTNEFAKIDTKPVVHEVWSKGKLVIAEPPRKKRKEEEPVVSKSKTEETKSTEKKKISGKRHKVWLTKGLYAGQETSTLDWHSGYGENERKEMGMATFQPKGILPLPMWHGQRLLHLGRNFQLPFDVCSPLPPGQPKPDEWRKTSSSMYTPSNLVVICLT